MLPSVLSFCTAVKYVCVVVSAVVHACVSYSTHGSASGSFADCGFAARASAGRVRATTLMRAIRLLPFSPYEDLQLIASARDTGSSTAGTLRVRLPVQRHCR